MNHLQKVMCTIILIFSYMSFAAASDVPSNIQVTQKGANLLIWNWKSIPKAEKYRVFLNGKYNYTMPNKPSGSGFNRYFSKNLKPGKYTFNAVSVFPNGSQSKMSETAYGEVKNDSTPVTPPNVDPPEQDPPKLDPPKNPLPDPGQNPLEISATQKGDNLLIWQWITEKKAVKYRVYLNGKYNYTMPNKPNGSGLNRYFSKNLKPGDYSLSLISIYANGSKSKMSEPGYATLTDGGVPPTPPDNDPPPKPDDRDPDSPLKSSGPINVTKDNITIKNLDIRSSDHSKCGIRIQNRKNVTIHNVNLEIAGAGICIFNSENIVVHGARIVNTIKVAGPHCRPGLSVKECKLTHRRKFPEKLYPVDSHNNIWIKGSKNVEIDTVYLEKGESGLFAYKTSGFSINNFHCVDIRGPYWRGQCVMVSQSHGATISNFYAQQFLETSSGHDNISAFNSDDVLVINGRIDGNWSRNGVGVIADSQADNMTIKNVDMTDQGVSGINVWSGPSNSNNGKVGRNFTVENVRVKNGHCDTTWRHIPGYGPSSGGMAFSMHPAAENARYINSIYSNHCRKSAVFSHGKPKIKDIKEKSFTMKKPPIDIHFPWLK